MESYCNWVCLLLAHCFTITATHTNCSVAVIAFAYYATDFVLRYRSDRPIRPKEGPSLPMTANPRQTALKDQSTPLQTNDMQYNSSESQAFIFNSGAASDVNCPDASPHTHHLRNINRDLLTLTAVLAFVITLVIIRGAYRIVEFSGGWYVFLATRFLDVDSP